MSWISLSHIFCSQVFSLENRWTHEDWRWVYWGSLVNVFMYSYSRIISCFSRHKTNALSTIKFKNVEGQMSFPHVFSLKSSNGHFHHLFYLQKLSNWNQIFVTVQFCKSPCFKLQQKCSTFKTNLCGFNLLTEKGFSWLNCKGLKRIHLVWI